jgi:transposase
MSAFPANNSVLVMDNCRIHHAAELIVDLQAVHGTRVEFLPPYSPDLNPIKEAFSTIKAWLRRNHDDYNVRGYIPKEILLFACCSVTADKSRGFYAHSGYV